MKTLVFSEKSTHIPVVNGHTGAFYGSSSIPIFHKQSLDLAYLVVQMQADDAEPVSEQAQLLICPSDIVYINDTHAIAVREPDPDTKWPDSLSNGMYTELLGKRVYTYGDVYVGRLMAVEIDGSTGALHTITVNEDGKDSVFPKEQIVAVGASVMLRSGKAEEHMDQGASPQKDGMLYGDVPEMLVKIQQQLTSISDYISLDKNHLQETAPVHLPQSSETGLHLPQEAQLHPTVAQEISEQENNTLQSEQDDLQLKMPADDLSQPVYQTEEMSQSAPAPSPQADPACSLKVPEAPASRQQSMVCPYSDTCFTAELLQRLTHIEALLELSVKNGSAQLSHGATDVMNPIPKKTDHEPIDQPPLTPHAASSIVPPITQPVAEPTGQMQDVFFDDVFLQGTTAPQEPTVQTVLKDPQLTEADCIPTKKDGTGVDARIRLSEQPEPVFDKPEAQPTSTQTMKADRTPQEAAPVSSAPKQTSQKKNTGVFWRTSAGHLLAMALFVAAYIALSTFHIL